MKRNTVNFIIDLLSLVVMWGLVTTGLLARYVMPPGTGHWLTLYGMNRHEWGTVHFWLAVGLCGLALVHVWLHWQWVCGTVSRFFGGSDRDGHRRSRAWRAVWGIALILLLTGGTAALLTAANDRLVQLEPSRNGDHRGEGPGRGRGRGARAGDTQSLDVSRQQSHEGSDRGSHVSPGDGSTQADAPAPKRRRARARGRGTEPRRID